MLVIVSVIRTFPIIVAFGGSLNILDSELRCMCSSSSSSATREIEETISPVQTSENTPALVSPSSETEADGQNSISMVPTDYSKKSDVLLLKLK